MMVDDVGVGGEAVIPASAMGAGGEPSPRRDWYALVDFAEDARAMDTAAFMAAHGTAFLLHHGPLGGLSPATRMQATISMDGTGAPGALEAVPPQLDFLVFPVRYTGRSPFPNFISLGRTPNNDVVINDVSISKFHAFFRSTDEGDLWLHDAGSNNGTFVDEKRVPRRDQGEPVLMTHGARFRVGTVEMTFLTAETLQTLVERAL